MGRRSAVDSTDARDAENTKRIVHSSVGVHDYDSFLPKLGVPHRTWECCWLQASHYESDCTLARS